MTYCHTSMRSPTFGHRAGRFAISPPLTAVVMGLQTISGCRFSTSAVPSFRIPVGNLTVEMIFF